MKHLFSGDYESKIWRKCTSLPKLETTQDWGFPRAKCTCEGESVCSDNHPYISIVFILKSSVWHPFSCTDIHVSKLDLRHDWQLGHEGETAAPSGATSPYERMPRGLIFSSPNWNRLLRLSWSIKAMHVSCKYKTKYHRENKNHLQRVYI